MADDAAVSLHRHPVCGAVVDEKARADGELQRVEGEADDGVPGAPGEAAQRVQQPSRAPLLAGGVRARQFLEAPEGRGSPGHEALVLGGALRRQRAAPHHGGRALCGASEVQLLAEVPRLDVAEHVGQGVDGGAHVGGARDPARHAERQVGGVLDVAHQHLRHIVAEAFAHLLRESDHGLELVLHDGGAAPHPRGGPHELLVHGLFFSSSEGDVARRRRGLPRQRVSLRRSASAFISRQSGCRAVASVTTLASGPVGALWKSNGAKCAWYGPGRGGRRSDNGASETVPQDF